MGERRRIVSEAAARVLARNGLGALSVRGVAAEAGLPPSTVRYVFPTQASVRTHALEAVFDATTRRVDAVPETLPDRERARRILLEAEGWEVVRFGPGREAECVALVRERLRRAAASATPSA